MKYIKINISFKERLMILFFGLIPENLLKSKLEINSSTTSQDQKKEYKEEVSMVENKNENKDNTENIPFFDLNEKNVKSNLDEE